MSSTGNVDMFMALFMTHDLVFSAVLMLSPVSGRYQVLLFSILELSVVIVVAVNKKRFSNVALFVKQTFFISEY